MSFLNLVNNGIITCAGNCNNYDLRNSTKALPTYSFLYAYYIRSEMDTNKRDDLFLKSVQQLADSMDVNEIEKKGFLKCKKNCYNNQAIGYIPVLYAMCAFNNN